MTPSLLAILKALGRVTWREILRDKVLYNILLITVLLFGLSFLASKLTFGRTDRIVLDFGLSALRISGVLIAIFNGSAMIGREYERRTVWVSLSRPITHLQWVWGKYVGLVGVLLLNWTLLSVVLLAMLAQTTQSPQAYFHPTLAWALGLALAEGCLVAAVSVFFSSFTTTSLSAILGVGVYLIGHNLSQLIRVAERLQKEGGPAASAILKGFVLLLPRLENLNLATRVTYLLPVPLSEGILYLLYTGGWVGFLVSASGLLLKKRVV